MSTKSPFSTQSLRTSRIHSVATSTRDVTAIQWVPALDLLEPGVLESRPRAQPLGQRQRLSSQSMASAVKTPVPTEMVTPRRMPRPNRTN